MKSKRPPVEETVPLQLKIRVLQAQLERVESDLHRLNELRNQTLKEIEHYEGLLAKVERYRLLRQVK